MWEGLHLRYTGRLVHGFLLPILEALDKACTRSCSKWTWLRKIILCGADTKRGVAAVFRTLILATLLTTAPVLSTIMDTTTPTPKHGIYTSLVSALCYFRQYSLSFPTRYDLRVLFDKAHGEFSVNVQALSRVRRICFRSCRNISDIPLLGRESSEDFPLGS